MPAKHLSIRDLSDRLGVPVPTLYRWNSHQTGPKYFRAGRHVRYRLADVEAWERAHEAGGERVA
ncbi:DNA binding domain-containing protein, excisionase family [Amycolatopsis pretoriensis]|uniref:DNA binding domain-containing protein, excisionase family n=1 Tax=Amycolatopsis pretoriensis TaxID=218821 RepID=A0A1H5RA58_9PSEU|nr:helix-turn-helix domain-containing protein [Amycolatopsis pretoriensis]SEF34481.1 DNA binding domain-containing protein, excisionase family [Amycolatopsis pretoriensis]